MGQNEQCTQYCNKVLQIDKSNEEATYMKANLLLMGEHTEKAIQTYQNLLDKEPDNYSILANLTELLRRAGRHTEVQPYLDKAEVNT
jgi:Tfp pilus assembly protein PilF